MISEGSCGTEDWSNAKCLKGREIPWMDGHSNTHIYCTGKLLSKIHLSCIVRKTGAPPMPIEEEYAKPTHK